MNLFFEGLPHQHYFRVESPSIEREPPVAGVYSPAPKRWNEAHSINFPSLFARCTWPHCNHVGLYCGQGDSALPHLQIGQWRDAATRREPLPVYFGNQESAARGGESFSIMDGSREVEPKWRNERASERADIICRQITTAR